ncbi:MAG: hypothetical protein R2798_02930 [Chitinophagales bacterium]|nr:hypothetical protein [Bacteroidota bacterium]MCB9042284.1 hypothetical protein [Chitinophagales bacterium]
MNAAHFHLIVNHFPIIAPIIGICVMLGGIILKSETVKRTAYCIFVIGAISAIFASLSGEGAEEVVEHLPGIDKHYIHNHEEAAETLAFLLYILGGLSIFGFYASLKNKAFAKFMPLVTLVFSLVVLFFAQKTGTTGGEIRHIEIRATTNTGNIPANRNAHEEDED